jgi:hypothetical protein
MKQKQRLRRGYISGLEKPAASSVSDLATRMSELQKLRDRVKKAEKDRHLQLKASDGVYGVDGSSGCLSDKMLEFGKDLFDGVQVG